ncbi:MAG: protein arginine kinase [Parachlamydiales bacterium]
MTANKDRLPLLSLHRPWSGNENPIWLASTLLLKRNLTRYRFPPKLDTPSRKQIRELIGGQLEKSSQLDKPYLVRAEEMDPLEKEFLFEHFLASSSFQQALSGEGFVVDGSGEFLATLNIGDHLQLHLTETHENLEESWNRLIKLETLLGRTLDYAYNPRFGFLTSDPMSCGTGTLISLYLHLPALIHVNSLEETVKRLEPHEVEAASIRGPLDDIVGDLLVLRNRCTIGLTGEDIVQSLRTQALNLIVAEKRLRSELKKMGSAEMKDKVARAFGLLHHSYQLEIHEAWGALSLLKLGLDLGWVSGTTHAHLNELLFTTRRAHLICEYSEAIGQEEVAHRRAEFVHASLQDIHLSI